MMNFVTDEKTVDTGICRSFLFVRLAKIDDRREARLSQELFENVDALSLYNVIAEQNYIIARTGELIGQLPGRREREKSSDT